MRYGFVSDVHANLPALEVALDALRDADALVFLGDAVGYGAHPNEVCNLLREHCAVAIVGNHDAAAVGRMDAAGYYEEALHALRWTQTVLTEENRAWLATLPYQQSAGGLLFSHGAPLVPEAFDYVFTSEAAEELASVFEALASVTFMGHTHLAFSYRIAPGEATTLLATDIRCVPPDKYCITVGSVGQPRDRDPRLSCGVWDDATLSFEYRRRPYDVAAAQRAIRAAGLAPMFADRLSLGV
jgi:diadenosine tetraphosphatase ApaH/serine/threonine PP2A family protein phosphatase